MIFRSLLFLFRIVSRAGAASLQVKLVLSPYWSFLNRVGYVFLGMGLVGGEGVLEAEGRGMRIGFWAGKRKTSDLVEGSDVWVVDVMS